MHRLVLMGAMVCFAVTTAGAQTKTSGTAKFAKADPQLMIPAGDRPDHTLGVAQAKCTWSKPEELGGDKSKDCVNTETNEVSGNRLRIRGVNVTAMQSGDKCFASYQGTGMLKEGVMQSGKGTWMYTGGTGKLKGITGKGTYVCKSAGDGVSCDIEGDYQLAK